jgi:hypothetical protein
MAKRGTSDGYMVDREKPSGFDEHTREFIYDWRNVDAGDPKKNKATRPPSDNVIRRLAPYKLTKPTLLHRGVREDQQMGSKTGYESWTKNKKVASGFAGRKGKVVSETIHPHHTLVDFGRVPGHELDINGNSEREVIVKSDRSK